MRFLNHFIRIASILALLVLAVFLSYHKWVDGKHVRAILQGLAVVGTAVSLGCWLYSGYFVYRPFGAYISRYRSRRFFNRDILPFILFSLLGAAVAVAFIAIKDKENPLVDPFFYIIFGGFILVFGMFKMIGGYIKYCYKKY